MGAPVPTSAARRRRRHRHARVLRRRSTTSIAGSLLAARENARGAREAISSEMWECLNATSTAAGERGPGRRAGPTPSCTTWGRPRCSAARRLHDEPRRRLAVPGAGPQPRTGRHDRPPALGQVAGAVRRRPGSRSARPYEAYLRTYRGRLEPDLVAEFLLLDRLFPRCCSTPSVRRSECWPSSSPRPTAPGPGRARRIVGAARATLAYTEPRTLTEELPRILTDVQHSMTFAHEAVADRFFRQAAAVIWSAEVVS